MKIFFFITKSETGGAQTHVAQLTKFFISRGDEVAIMSEPGGWLEKETARLGAHFFSNPYLSHTPNPLRLIKAARSLSQTVQDTKPDLVACHSTVAGLLGRLTIRNRIPTVFTAHGWGFTHGAPLLRRLSLPLLERLAARFSSAIICVSQNDLRLAQNRHIAPAQKLVQIYNGVELPESIPVRQPSDSIHIFFIGRLSPPKDPFMLVNALLALPKLVQNKIRVTIIGNGPQMSILRSYIHQLNLESRVELAGSYSRENLLHRLQSEADIFVLLSRWEGFPYSILEAMARGIPIIATDVGGVKEAVGTEEMLIPARDIKALTKTLEQLITNPQLRLELGEQGRRRVQEYFSLEQMCEKTLRVYSDILETYEQGGNA